MIQQLCDYELHTVRPMVKTNKQTNTVTINDKRVIVERIYKEEEMSVIYGWGKQIYCCVFSLFATPFTVLGYC